MPNRLGFDAGWGFPTAVCKDESDGLRLDNGSMLIELRCFGIFRGDVLVGDSILRSIDEGLSDRIQPSLSPLKESRCRERNNDGGIESCENPNGVVVPTSGAGDVEGVSRPVSAPAPSAILACRLPGTRQQLMVELAVAVKTN
jgi:hypothetical protein